MGSGFRAEDFEGAAVFFGFLAAVVHELVAGAGGLLGALADGGEAGSFGFLGFDESAFAFFLVGVSFDFFLDSGELAVDSDLDFDSLACHVVLPSKKVCSPSRLTIFYKGLWRCKPFGFGVLKLSS